MCWPLRHKWEAVGCFCDGMAHYISRQGRHTAITDVALRCKKCGRLKSRMLLGMFTLAQLQGESTEVAKVLSQLEKSTQ
jgi:hypothetical protein